MQIKETSCPLYWFYSGLHLLWNCVALNQWLLLFVYLEVLLSGASVWVRWGNRCESLWVMVLQKPRARQFLLPSSWHMWENKPADNPRVSAGHSRPWTDSWFGTSELDWGWHLSFYCPLTPCSLLLMAVTSSATEKVSIYIILNIFLNLLFTLSNLPYVHICVTNDWQRYITKLPRSIYTNVRINFKALLLNTSTSKIFFFFLKNYSV